MYNTKHKVGKIKSIIKEVYNMSILFWRLIKQSYEKVEFAKGLLIGNKKSRKFKNISNLKEWIPTNI